MGLGFTPINAAAKVATDGRNNDSDEHDDAVESCTIVSEYLGRGEAAKMVPSPTGTRKASAKERERSAPRNDAANTKRERIGSLNDGYRVAKRTNAMASPAVDAECHSPATNTKKTTYEQKSTRNADQVGAAEDKMVFDKVKPVNVYASATSMGALDTTSSRTSLDSVKANAGQSVTVYHRSLPSSSANGGVEFSRPLLDATRYKAQKDLVPFSQQQNAQGSTYTGTPTQEAQPSTSSSQTASEDEAAKRLPVTSLASHFIAQTRALNKGRTSDHDLEHSRRSDHLRKFTNGFSRHSNTCITEKAVEHGEFSDVEDDDLMELAESLERCVDDPTPPPRKKSQNMREVDEHEDYGGRLLTATERKILTAARNSENGKVRPIVRNPIQPSLLNRSSIWGASNGSMLRTCFRLGEALNAGSQALRSNQAVVLEVYARVTFSWRDKRKQFFVFNDLYHDKPPHLEGTFELWDQSALWDLDSKAFLRASKQGIMCRTISKMRREQQKWRLEILSIWEATWEDITWVAGICTGESGKKDGDED